MENKLRLVEKTVFVTCNWVPTGDPKMPLACVWTVSKSGQAVSNATSTSATTIPILSSRRKQWTHTVGIGAGSRDLQQFHRGRRDGIGNLENVLGEKQKAPRT